MAKPSEKGPPEKSGRPPQDCGTASEKRPTAWDKSFCRLWFKEINCTKGLFVLTEIRIIRIIMPTAPLAQANYSHYSNFCQSFYANFFQPHELLCGPSAGLVWAVSVGGILKWVLRIRGLCGGCGTCGYFSALLGVQSLQQALLPFQQAC